MTVHIYSFLFLYNVVFFWFPFVVILYLVCKIFMRHLLLLQMEDYLGYFGDDLPVWPSACELVQNLHVDQPISVLPCTSIARIAFLRKEYWVYISCPIYDNSDQLLIMRNPKKGYQGYNDIILKCVKTFFFYVWASSEYPACSQLGYKSVLSEYEPFMCM